jgi:hypothetical protein
VVRYSKATFEVMFHDDISRLAEGFIFFFHSFDVMDFMIDPYSLSYSNNYSFFSCLL